MPTPATPSPPVRHAAGQRGMVVAAHPLAAEAARGVLASGGNAIDAAVAAAAILTVVCPYACTLGGDVFALVHSAADRTVHGLNGSGVAPRAATPELFGATIPRTGGLSISVPGVVAGLADLVARFGTRSWRSLLEPAAVLARDGFAAHGQQVQNTRARADLIAQNAEAARLFLPGGAPPGPGQPVRQPELADTLQRIAEDGPRAFYAGDLAHRMADAIRAAGGVVTTDDFAAHVGLWQEPIGAPFAGRAVLTMPPNSYGLTLLLQLLELEAGGIADVDAESIGFVRRGLAARRAAYAAADGLVGDPAALEEPARRLLGDAIAGRLAVATTVPEEARDRCTACVVTMDAAGNAVSLIQSISAPYGSGVVAPGTGVLFNNRMPGFTTRPAHANRVAPGKRPAHTLAPCLVMQDGAPVIAIGTPGTVGQTCVLAQILTRLLVRGQPPAEALAAPRWSMTLEGKPAVEAFTPEAKVAALLAAEPELAVLPKGWITFGSIKLAMRTADGFDGYADDRRIASAAGC